MDIMSILATLQGSGSDILSATLMIIGGLKVIARYTPFTWDDKALEVVEAPVVYVVNFFKKKQ